MDNPFGIDPTSLSREIPVRFSGPAGPLEGLWRPPAPGADVQGAVVVAHPHPAYQGTMLNKVVFHLARVLNHDHRLASLRFNFRGVGASAGQYDEGRGEVDDVAAAWREARRRVPGGRLVAAGFSFGAAMTLLAGKNHGGETPAPDCFALVGMPLRLFELPAPFPRAVPLAAAHGELDAFTSPERVATYLRTWPGPHRLHVEPGADHFLTDHLPPAMRFLSEAVAAF